MTSLATNPAPIARVSPGLVKLRVNLALFVASLVVMVAVINFFAHRPSLRTQIDATKTRAYSLTPATREMLANLQGQWTIALVMDERRADRSMRRQIDEVLSRYTEANANLRVLRINPSDPRTMANYDAVLAQLQSIYRAPMADYDAALDLGVAAFKELQLFAQQQSGLLSNVLANMRSDDPLRDQLEQRIGVLSLLAEQGELVIDEVVKARRTDGARPIADYETARSILAQALAQWAGEIDDLGRLVARWLERPDVDANLKQTAASTRQDYSRTAQKLAEAAAPLKSLPAMELSTIGRQLEQGEGAVVLSPTKAAVIPSQQLFPRSNIRQREDGGVTFDQRFRGEQLLSSAIRSLTVPIMPLVVFIHAEEGSLLRQRDKQVDLLGAASMLQSCRYEIAEWMLADQSSKRPTPQPGQAAVWVVIAPPARKSIEISSAERELINATQGLIDEGQNVMLSVYPSLMHKVAQPDPWSKLVEALGMTVDTSKVILHSAATGEGQSEAQRAVQIQDFGDESLIGRAVDGQLAYFALPMPVGASGNASTGMRIDVIAAVQPEAEYWLEADWSADPSTLGAPSQAQRFSAPQSIVASMERDGPGGRGSQRALVIGSGGWMLTYIADVVTSVGGDRVALVYPGNHELMLAGVAWLAGMDDLIAASPIAQEVPRLRGVTPAARALWFWLLVVLAPGLCVATGAIVAVVRRN